MPATGPYRIAALDRQHLQLERNRRFRVWSPLAKPDGYPDIIDARFGIGPDEAAQAVRSGRSDFASVNRFGSTTAAELRRGDPGLVRDALYLASSWLFLNTRVPPFDRADARRAVSLAIDRPAAVAAFGGRHAALATCSILPPTSSGYRPDCPARDLRKARRLVRRSGTHGALVTVWSGKPGFSSLNPVIVRALRAIGYRTRVHSVPMEEYFSGVADGAEPGADRADGVGRRLPVGLVVLDRIFSCRGLRGPRPATRTTRSTATRASTR